MREQFLNEKDDVEWLLTTHLKGVKLPFKPKSFNIFGNEDAPNKVHLYAKKNPRYDDPYVEVKF